ncbi:MAG: hypothetical protein WCW33_05125 [Candidatus Babeliales bacterium]
MYQRFILIFFLLLLTDGVGIQELQPAILAKQDIVRSPEFKEGLRIVQADVLKVIMSLRREEGTKPSHNVSKIVHKAVKAMDIPTLLRKHDKTIIESLHTLIKKVYDALEEDPIKAQKREWQEEFRKAISDIQKIYSSSLRTSAEDILIKFCENLNYPAISIDVKKAIKQSNFALKLEQADQAINYLVDYIRTEPKMRANISTQFYGTMPTWLNNLKDHALRALTLLDGKFLGEESQFDQDTQLDFFWRLQNKINNPQILRAFGDQFISFVISENKIHNENEKAFIAWLIRNGFLTTEKLNSLDQFIKANAQVSHKEFHQLIMAAMKKYYPFYAKPIPQKIQKSVSYEHKTEKQTKGKLRKTAEQSESMKLETEKQVESTEVARRTLCTLLPQKQAIINSIEPIMPYEPVIRDILECISKLDEPVHERAVTALSDLSHQPTEDLLVLVKIMYFQNHGNTQAAADVASKYAQIMSESYKPWKDTDRYRFIQRNTRFQEKIPEPARAAFKEKIGGIIRKIEAIAPEQE